MEDLLKAISLQDDLLSTMNSTNSTAAESIDGPVMSSSEMVDGMVEIVATTTTMAPTHGTTKRSSPAATGFMVSVQRQFAVVDNSVELQGGRRASTMRANHTMMANSTMMAMSTTMASRTMNNAIKMSTKQSGK